MIRLLGLNKEPIVLLSQARLYTEKEISQSQIELLKSLKKDTKDILEKARDRLNKAFDIKLALPS